MHCVIHSVSVEKITRGIASKATSGTGNHSRTPERVPPIKRVIRKTELLCINAPAQRYYYNKLMCTYSEVLISLASMQMLPSILLDWRCGLPKSHSESLLSDRDYTPVQWNKTNHRFASYDPSLLSAILILFREESIPSPIPKGGMAL